MNSTSSLSFSHPLIIYLLSHQPPVRPTWRTWPTWMSRDTPPCAPPCGCPDKTRPRAAPGRTCEVSNILCSASSCLALIYITLILCLDANSHIYLVRCQKVSIDQRLASFSHSSGVPFLPLSLECLYSRQDCVPIYPLSLCVNVSVSAETLRLPSTLYE